MKTLIALDGTELQVSDCDHLFLSGYNWHSDGRGYYKCGKSEIWNGYKTWNRCLHWFVTQLMSLKIPKGFEIDHIDRNKSNNQQPNLRAISREMQRYNQDIYKNNTSGFIGVSFDKRCTINPWIARIRINNKSKFLGFFRTAIEASEEYQFAKKLRDDAEIKRCEEVINENAHPF